MSGSTDDDLPGNYNSSCSFDSLNLPASRFEQRAAVTDYCNRFWMYGGFSANAGMLNDLWVFDSQILQWSLLSGSSAINQSGSYGALGVASPNNLPPSRAGAVAWWGNDNKYYLFGGTENNSFTSFSDLWMFDPDTNCIAFDCSLPVVAGFAVSDSTFCEKQCIDFTDISQNNPTSWLWTFSGASPSVSTSQHPSNICYNAFGSFDVSLIACNLFGCDTIIRSNYITSYPTPLDSIWFTNDTLFALPAYSYQWYEVGAGLIANATLNYYVPLTLGNYYCITIDSNGCESTSNVIFYTSFFENENNQIASAIWPNPANDVLFINPALLTYNKIVFEIYDMSARIIKHEIIQGSRPIKIDNLAASVYGYRIMSNSNIIAQGRFVKN
ncbi:MAG: T9SS type A sorting domain-containing protein [Bacteroidetes bacterium]|nr:T9SS type A sorting domain-containing protein [Bacteroidota bacterium]